MDNQNNNIYSNDNVNSDDFNAGDFNAGDNINAINNVNADSDINAGNRINNSASDNRVNIGDLYGMNDLRRNAAAKKEEITRLCKWNDYRCCISIYGCYTSNIKCGSSVYS